MSDLERPRPGRDRRWCPITISWNEGIHGYEGWCILKGTPRLEAAREFVTFCANAENQYVTHDQEEALVMSDRICLMNEGEIEQLGTPDDLYFRPETVFAADFLGESNLLDARVAGTCDRAVRLQGPNHVTITAPARGEVFQGQNVKCMVRPENVRVLAQGEEADNTLVAHLQDVILLGQVTKYYAKLPDGTDVCATQLTRHSIPKFRPGEEVRFGFDLESTVVLPLDKRTTLP